MSAAVVDRLMALADDCALWDQERRKVFKSSLVEALDLGEPLAWISDRDQLQLRMGDKPGANWRPLYAAPKAKP